jgi:hypothetical protein
MMETLVGNLGQPLSRLAVHIVQIREITQRPEVLAHVSDAAALDLPLFPPAGRIASPRDEVVFAGESQEPRVEAHQAAIVFGYGRSQVVIENFPTHAIESGEGVNVTPHEGLKTLAVGELQIGHPAVSVNQGEGIQLTLIAFVAEAAEVAPIHLEAFAGFGLHAHEGPFRLRLWAHLMNVFAQDGVATVIAKRPQSLLDDGSAGAGVLVQQFGDRRLEGIQFTEAGPSRRRLRRRFQILLDRAPAHVQMLFDLANGPVLDPIQVMQVVDLVGGEHGLVPFMEQKATG